MKNLLVICLAIVLWGCDEVDSRTSGAVVIDVAENQVVCSGVTQQRCYQVRLTPNGPWELLYGDIQDFDYLAGFRYTIKVEPHRVTPDNARQSPVAWRLVEVLKRTAVAANKKDN